MSRVYYIACGILLVIVGIISLMSFSIKEKTNAGELDYHRNHPAQIVEISELDLSIKEGYVSQKEETVEILRDGKVVAYVKFGKPVVVAQADQEEKWGYFQFPTICRSEDGKLIVSWQMNEDSHKAYGKAPKGRAMSRDEGKTWEPLDEKYFIKGDMSLTLRNGDVLQIVTPKSKEINQYSSFPKPVFNDSHLKMKYYLEKNLPDDLRGVFFNKRDGKTKSNKGIHGEIDDPGLIRYAIDDMMPLMWWGEMEELDDGTILGGIYRTYYLNQDDETPKSAITFYASKDGGYHWKAIGKIPYRIEEIEDKSREYDRTRGFSEASFEVLKDKSLFCVLRSGYNTPMYKTYSYDGGRNWTEPEAFTPNGVRPQLLQLYNGIMIMVSGRPGVQLRFCINADGVNWTEPIEMFPFMDENGNYDMWGVSCGYSRLLSVDKNTFYMVYSDFGTQNTEGELRKSIMFRKVSLTKRR